MLMDGLTALRVICLQFKVLGSLEHLLLMIRPNKFHPETARCISPIFQEWNLGTLPHFK